MRSRETVIVFLCIIVSSSAYVVYQNLLSKTEATNGSAFKTATISFNFDEPSTFEEMKSDLQAVGCDTIITISPSMSGYRDLSYNDALQLAKKAHFVGVTKDQSIAFIFYLDGTWWIWLKSSQESTQPTPAPTPTPTPTQSGTFEKVEIQSALSIYNSSSVEPHWKVTMMVKNTGTATTTLDKVFINGIEVNDYGDSAPPDADEAGTNLPSTGYTINNGASYTLYIYIDNGWGLVSSGTTINIKLHSTGGMEYLKLVELV